MSLRFFWLSIFFFLIFNTYAQHSDEDEVPLADSNSKFNTSSGYLLKAKPSNLITFDDIVDINNYPDFIFSEVFIENEVLFSAQQLEINKANTYDFFSIGFSFPDAQRIVNHRNLYGLFVHINQIQSVDSIDFIRFSSIQHLLYIKDRPLTIQQIIKKAKPKAELFSRFTLNDDNINSISSIKIKLKSTNAAEAGFHIRTDNAVNFNLQASSTANYNGLFYGQYTNSYGKWFVGSFMPSFGVGLNYQFGSGYRFNEGIYGRALSRSLQVHTVKSVNTPNYLTGVALQRVHKKTQTYKVSSSSFIAVNNDRNRNINPFILDSLSTTLLKNKELVAGAIIEVQRKAYVIQQSTTLKNLQSSREFTPEIGLALSKKTSTSEFNIESKMEVVNSGQFQFSSIANFSHLLFKKSHIISVSAYYYAASTQDEFSNALSYNSTNANSKGLILHFERFSPKKWYYYLQGHIAEPIIVRNSLYEPVPNTKLIGNLTHTKGALTKGVQTRLENRSTINLSSAYTRSSAFIDVFIKLKSEYSTQQTGIQLATTQDSRNALPENGQMLYYQISKKFRYNALSVATYLQFGGASRFYQQEFEISSFARIQQLSGNSKRIALMWEHRFFNGTKLNLKTAYTYRTNNSIMEVSLAALY